MTGYCNWCRISFPVFDDNADEVYHNPQRKMNRRVSGDGIVMDEDLACKDDILLAEGVERRMGLESPGLLFRRGIEVRGKGVDEGHTFCTSLFTRPRRELLAVES